MQAWLEEAMHRLVDEWGQHRDADGDFMVELHEVLVEALAPRPDLIEKLVGTELIESDYFENIDEDTDAGSPGRARFAQDEDWAEYRKQEGIPPLEAAGG